MIGVAIQWPLKMLAYTGILSSYVVVNPARFRSGFVLRPTTDKAGERDTPSRMFEPLPQLPQLSDH